MGLHSPPLAQQVNEKEFQQAKPLKDCDKCAKPRDVLGGVDVRGKWYCAGCWIKFVNRR